MAKKSISYARLFLCGIIWTPLYTALFIRFYHTFFHFNLLSSRSWSIRWQAFTTGQWIISTPHDWGFLIGLVLFIPLLCLGCFLCYKAHFEKLLQKKEKIALPHANKKTNLERRAFEPAKMRVQTSAILTVSPTAPTHQQPADTTNSIPPIPPQGTPQFEDEAEVQQILSLTAGIPADFFPHVSIDGAYASFALSTEHSAAVVKLINQPDSVWAVDTDVEIDKSDWFNQTSSLSAPAKDLLYIIKNLQENEPESLAIPVILLMSGKVLNIEETLDYFEKNNILLLRLETAETDEIPLFTDFIKEFFTPEEGNTQQ